MQICEVVDEARLQIVLNLVNDNLMPVEDQHEEGLGSMCDLLTQCL